MIEPRTVIAVVPKYSKMTMRIGGGIRRLLTASGYQVSTASDEEDAVLKAGVQRPDLFLVSLGLSTTRVVATARRIRERAGLGE